jgi:hypothetical protein
MDPTYVAYALAAILAGLAGKDIFSWLTAKDTAQEARRRAAFDLAGVLRKYGLKRIPEFLGDYAVGDFSGMYDKIYDLAKVSLAGDDAIVKELGQVFDNVLAAKLKTEDGRALLAAKLAEANAVAALVPEVDLTKVSAKS